jgi:hypothetical protein
VNGKVLFRTEFLFHAKIARLIESKMILLVGRSTGIVLYKHKTKLTGNISTAPLSGFFERTVPVTLGVVDDAFTFGIDTVEVILLCFDIICW